VSSFDTILVNLLHETAFADYVASFRLTTDGAILDTINIPGTPSWMPWGGDSIRFHWATPTAAYTFAAIVKGDSLHARSLDGRSGLAVSQRIVGSRMQCP
jgi:hypothetical protein